MERAIKVIGLEKVYTGSLKIYSQAALLLKLGYVKCKTIYSS